MSSPPGGCPRHQEDVTLGRRKNSNVLAGARISSPRESLYQTVLERDAMAEESLSLEKLVEEKNATHSTEISDDDDDSLIIQHDQDHNDTVKDVQTLQAKLLSLDMENKKKDIIINEKENELDVAREELKDLLETCF